MKLIM